MHYEQVIRKKPDKIVIFLKGFILLCAVLLCNFIFSNILFIVGMYGLLVYPLVLGIIWLLFRRLTFEFEYSFYDGILQVDKITAKSSRSVLAVCDIKTVLDYGYVTELSREERNSPSLPCIYAQGSAVESVVYMEYQAGNRERVRLYFSPDTNLKTIVEHSLPGRIKEHLP